MKIGKRLFDLFWTIPGLLILSPFFLFVALLIKLDDGGPVYFRQERVGLGGKPFKIWKFRTMVVDAEKLGLQLTVGSDPRISEIGKYLRKFKLDELPQLFNVLAGEMSLVGPRPEVPKYTAMYSPAQRRVLDLVPGITDPASIKYKDENDVLAAASNPEKTYIEEIMPEKIRLNLEYSANAGVWNDFLIVLRTLVKIF